MRFNGKYEHKYSRLLLRYSCEYRFTLIGVQYVAEAGFDTTKKTRLVSGVIVWGLRALPPRRRVESAERECIDIIDIEKFAAKIAETAAEADEKSS